MMAIKEAGFEVSALQMFHLEKANAEEFFEVYKGVVAEFTVRTNFKSFWKVWFCLLIKK